MHSSASTSVVAPTRYSVSTLQWLYNAFLSLYSGCSSSPSLVSTYSNAVSSLLSSSSTLAMVSTVFVPQPLLLFQFLLISCPLFMHQLLRIPEPLLLPWFLHIPWPLHYAVASMLSSSSTLAMVLFI